jgi:hypothetical protein
MLKIELIKQESRLCYFESFFKITSSEILSGNQLDHLRQAGFFSYGQECGKVFKKYEENENYIYELITIRDSGD